MRTEANVAPYAIMRVIAMPFMEADRCVRETLAQEGFGVLTEIDVRATLRKKLDVDFPDYEILGACNPRLAYEALKADPDIGLLLPCNVVVRAGDRAGETIVEAIDPTAQLTLGDGAALESVAQEVRARLVRALDRVAEEKER